MPGRRRGRRRRCPRGAPPRAASPRGRSSRSAPSLPRAGRRPARASRSRAGLAGERRGEHGALGVEDDGRLDLRGDLRQVGESGRGIHGARRYCRRAPPVRATPRQVLRRPRHAPGGDDRLLRAPLLRLADLPRARAARLHRAGRGVELPRRELQNLFPSQSIADIVEVVEAITENATTLGLIGGALPALDVALALQRARVGLQHRLRAAEPARSCAASSSRRCSWPAR